MKKDGTCAVVRILLFVIAGFGFYFANQERDLKDECILELSTKKHIIENLTQARDLLDQ